MVELRCQWECTPGRLPQGQPHRWSACWSVEGLQCELLAAVVGLVKPVELELNRQWCQCR